VSELTAERIKEAVDDRAGAIVEWTKALVRFASENRPPDGDEADVQLHLAEQCRALGLEVDLFSPQEMAGAAEHPFWLAGRDYSRGRKNLAARWRGVGGGRSILLSGHSDVAPSDPAEWTVCPPYEPVVRDGRLYGRGSADMKGGLAAAFWAVRVLHELGFAPRGDVLFESVVDEEYASGNGTLAARLKGYNADLAVVTEPTGMEVCPACFGAFLGDLRLTGKGGMPYTGDAIANPLVGAARAVELLYEFQTHWRQRNRHELFDGPGKELNVLAWRIENGAGGQTVQMGTPREVSVSWIVWCHPGMTEEHFYPEFQAYWEGKRKTEPALEPFDLALEKTYHSVRPWETSRDDPAIAAVARAAEAVRGSAVVSGAPFSCDLGVYGEIGRMPSVLFGPRGGNLHGVDEWVSIRDVLDLTATLATLIKDL